MAQTGYAPVPFWLTIPLTELQSWIEAHNKLCKEHDKLLKEHDKK